MADIPALLERARAYAARSELSISTVSRKVLGNGKRLDELAAGKSLRVDTLERANEILDQLERAA